MTNLDNIIPVLLGGIVGVFMMIHMADSPMSEGACEPCLLPQSSYLADTVATIEKVVKVPAKGNYVFLPCTKSGKPMILKSGSSLVLFVFDGSGRAHRFVYEYDAASFRKVDFGPDYEPPPYLPAPQDRSLWQRGAVDWLVVRTNFSDGGTGIAPHAAGAPASYLAE